MAKMTCGSWVCCSQENKRPVIRWALVSQSHHHVPGGCLLAQTQFVTSFDNLFECPKLWPLHLLWKTEGFGVAIPETPYLLLSLVYLNTSGALQGCLSLFFLFVCFGYCFSAIPPKSTTGDYSTKEGKHWDLHSSVPLFAEDNIQIFMWNSQKGHWSPCWWCRTALLKRSNKWALYISALLIVTHMHLLHNHIKNAFAIISIAIFLTGGGGHRCI